MKLSERQWSDVTPRLTNRACTACGEHHILHEPRYAKVGDIDMLITTCTYCGHVEMFDVEELAKLADALDREYRENGQR